MEPDRIRDSRTLQPAECAQVLDRLRYRQARMVRHHVSGQLALLRRKLREYSKSQMTARGFKGMASTRLNEMGCWNPDAIERQLAHQESDDVRRAYTHAAEYWPERVKMMQAWADYLDELRDAGKLIPLRQPSVGGLTV